MVEPEKTGSHKITRHMTESLKSSIGVVETFEVVKS